MKVKTLVGALIFLIVLNIGVVGTIVYLHVTDQRPPISRFFEGSPRFDPPFAQQMEEVERLTPEQRQQLIQMFQSFRQKIEPIHQEVEVLEQRLVEILASSDSTDTGEVRRIMRQIAELRLEIGGHVLDNLQQAKTFLSEEQQRVFIRRIISAGPPSRMEGPPFPGTPRRELERR